MILTSNRGFAEWGEVFSDPVVATALLDRLLHHAVVVQIEGASYRVRQHADLIPETLRIRTPAAATPLPVRRRGRPPKDRSADHTTGCSPKTELRKFTPPKVRRIHPALTAQ